MNFDTAFERLIGHEGGYTSDPQDRGNWTTGKIGKGELKGTKYGVSAMSYPGEDIPRLTLDRAKQIYKRDYWGSAGCDLVPEQIKFELFDAAVHAGTTGAIKMLQRALAVIDDGKIGPVTMLAISNTNPYRLAMRFTGHRLDHLNNNPEQWARYGRGWAQRIAENLMAA
jgi:lysozyme family protein